MRNVFMPRRVLCSAAVAVAAAIILGRGPSARAEAIEETPAFLAALSASSAISGARVAIVAFDLPAPTSRSPGNCMTSGPDARIETARPIDGSGRVAVKVTGSRPGGTTCEVWAWVRVRMFAKVPVTRRAVRAGETLASAAATEEREIKSGHLPASWADVVAQGSVAEHSLGAGQVIEADAVRAPGPRAGESVKILIVSGALAIEQIGHAVPCARGKSCALLPSGKHIEGTLVDGRLMVQLP